MDKSQKLGKRIVLRIFIWCFSFMLIALAAFSGIFFYNYNQDIKYRGIDQKINFEVEPGDSISSVAQELKKYHIIKSQLAFEFYAKINNKGQIKAGKYELSPNMTIPEILDVLNSGPNRTTFNITFLPGGTVKMAKNSLKKIGFSDKEIEDGFAKKYDSEFPKLFTDKPESADLEGFLWGETHTFEKGAKVEDILRRFFKDFENKVISLNLATKFKKQGLNLYEGIVLASIVQKESLSDQKVGPEASLRDKKNIAGVFFNRIKNNMNLGSDVTYQYIADKTGQQRDFNLNSEYNLRIHKGLTPTPIATPSENSLLAVAEPARHDFLFFLSGDDDITYFGKNDRDHQQNIKNHCQKKCQII